MSVPITSCSARSTVPSPPSTTTMSASCASPVDQVADARSTGCLLRLDVGHDQLDVVQRRDARQAAQAVADRLCAPVRDHERAQRARDTQLAAVDGSVEAGSEVSGWVGGIWMIAG